jgi:transketolase
VDCLSSRIARSRLRLLDLHFEAGVGHIGGGFSCIDALVTLFHEVLGEDDVFVLSKGHAAGALYVALWSVGKLSDDDLATFATDGTKLGVHPPARGLADVRFATGSLGHGPSLSVGVALGMRLRGLGGRAFCLCSDGEWQEGSCWEALSCACHQQLSSLTVLIDVNGWQGFGRTTEVASVDGAGLARRCEAFGAEVRTCDGHDAEAILSALHGPPAGKGPVVILLNTRKGKGIAFFEDMLESHYLPLNRLQYEAARQSLETA